jgi:hypothetical protein
MAETVAPLNTVPNTEINTFYSDLHNLNIIKNLQRCRIFVELCGLKAALILIPEVSIRNRF